MEVQDHGLEDLQSQGKILRRQKSHQSQEVGKGNVVQVWKVLTGMRK